MIATREETMQLALRFAAAGVVAALGLAMPAAAEETPKHGGILTYVIPADAPPSFDAHREVTYATIHSASPFYSVLIRINPMNPGSTTDFVCDLCTEMPTPTDNGKTYTFKIRDGVKFHDGSPLTAAALAASATPIIITRDCPISTALSGSTRPSRRPGSMRSAPTGRRSSFAACRRRRATSSSRCSATKSPCRPATGIAPTS